MIVTIEPFQYTGTLKVDPSTFTKQRNTMRISFGVPLEPMDPPRDNTFSDIKASEDFHTWQGNACTLPLPGGGNNPTGPGGKGNGKER